MLLIWLWRALYCVGERRVAKLVYVFTSVYRHVRPAHSHLENGSEIVFTDAGDLVRAVVTVGAVLRGIGRHEDGGDGR